MHIIQVDTPSQQYPVYIGPGLIDRVSEIIGKHSQLKKRCAIISDSNVAKLYGEKLRQQLGEAGYQCDLFCIDAGEAAKSFASVEQLSRQMICAGHSRRSFVIALGGGVVGDLAGFVASIYYRGIPFVQIPTTIVSQVDSSLGGKTGINTAEGKNLIGSFHQPVCVITDTALLHSLPEREYYSGFAEIIKHALIADTAMLHELEQAVPSPADDIKELIASNVAIKANVVSKDETESSGIREWLNFGHTIGHGIENAAGYGRFFHGEAISFGLLAAVRLSAARTAIDPNICSRLEKLLTDCHLPTVLPADIATPDIMLALQNDKKFVDGSIRFVLLRDIAEPYVDTSLQNEDLRLAIEQLR